MKNPIHSDLFIIGGGINGVGIAADAARKGLSVTLCEQNDLASGTSSKSTKLIHGGLRYLEYYEFRLVREALQEREVLLKKAPHLISPMHFVLPHNKAFKPAWMLKLGLFLYDHLGKRSTLPASEHVYFNKHPARNIIRDRFQQGFVYSDCWVDDARLVVLNAMQAKEHNANILTRTRFISAIRKTDHWEIILENTRNHDRYPTTATALVNAAGPWVDDVIHQKLHLESKDHVSLVKGSHIVVPKLYDESFAFILTNPDHRVIFVIPYLEKYSLIGTTDIPFTGDPALVSITNEEVNYLCEAVNRYFIKNISPQDVIWSYSGVRPLHSENVSNPSAITRDYALKLSTVEKHAPLISVFGGKITTYRKLAEHTLKMLHPFFQQMKPISTDDNPLPGGDIINGNLLKFEQNILEEYPFLSQELAKRWVKSYGTRVRILLQHVRSLADLGVHIGGDLYEIEVEYLKLHEWAETAEDILWRRTKLGLSLSETEQRRLEDLL